ncbi:MAG: type III-B CRISPR module RAMP protein Cmr4 [Planctomycetes bacterium]|nr:type III-B CRISPR module RAMP protein Cmr4 [Planctomycetota bacterium]
MNDAIGSSQAKCLLFIHARTSLHPGSGAALGVVDLPVQRERHTHWPLIPGSSLKGVLRDACGRGCTQDQKEKIPLVFGPETKDADKHAGAISFTDARILAFPVRSLKGVFAWITCDSVLRRFARDAKMAGLDGPTAPGPAEKNKAICAANAPLLVNGTQIVLEEFEFAKQADAPAGWSDALARLVFRDEDERPMFRDRLVVLHDDDFGHFVRHATEVVARIGLDAATKTVKNGALFYQEFLPTETLLYSVVIANASRNGRAMAASDVLKFVSDGEPGIPEILQIGGDETIGKGLCAVHFSNGKGGA